MAKYYNKSRGPLTITLSDGTTVPIRGKSWSQDIPRALEGSSDLMQKVKRGLLRRGPELRSEPVVTVSEVEVEKKVSEPVVSSVEEPPAPVVVEPPKKSRRKKKKKTSSEEESKTSSTKE